MFLHPSSSTCRHLIGAALLGSLPCAPSEPPVLTVHQGKPPTDIVVMNEMAPYMISHPGDIHQAIGIRCGAERSGVVVTWRYSPPPNNDDDHAFEVEEYAVPYWPTAIALEGADRVRETGKRLLAYIAGKSPHGDTLIEEWEFERSTSAPRVIPIESDDHPRYAWVFPRRTRVTEVFRRRSVELDMVSAMFMLHGAEHRLLVQFWGSRDVYTIDARDGSFERVLSSRPTNSALVLHQPALAESYTHFDSFDHIEHGFTYIFGQRYWGVGTPLPHLVLADPDRNGSIDKTFLVPSERWCSVGWGDASSIRRMFYP